MLSRLGHICLAFFVVFASVPALSQDLASIQSKAEAGDAQAQNTLGVRYQSGEGVERDYARAREWYSKAAKQGYPVAEFNLGVLYFDALGVHRDEAAAAAWFLVASDKGADTAGAALEHFDKFVRSEGEFQAYCLYREGNDIPADPTLGFKHLLVASRRRFPPGSFHLCRAYATGWGVPVNANLARQACENAGADGDTAAYAYLANLYLTGSQVERSFAKAKNYFEKAAGKNDGEAAFQLGTAYLSAEKPDKVAAYEWFLLAASMNNPSAVQKLSILERELQKKDIEKARGAAKDWAFIHRLVLPVKGSLFSAGKRDNNACPFPQP